MRARGNLPVEEPVDIDVDNYMHRVKVLDILTEFCRLPEWAADPMDGDRIQTLWQAETGRDQLAWWSRINYCLVIWRLQALQSAGKLQHVRLVGDLETKPALPSHVSSYLLRYYRAVRAFRKHSGSSPGMLQKLFWLVHEHTVVAALRSASKLHGSLPEGERAFALGWGAVMVKVLAQTNFSTGRATIGRLNHGMLPKRILRVADLDLDGVSDLPEPQRKTAGIIAALYGRLSLLSLFLPILAFGAPLVELFIVAEQRFREAFLLLARRGAK
jgi:hypothetical protein